MAAMENSWENYFCNEFNLDLEKIRLQMQL